MPEKDESQNDSSKQEKQGLKNRFDRDLKESKRFMDPIQQRMDRDYEVYRNYRTVEDCEFKISDFYAYVETIVPIVTNNRIRASVHSEYPDYVAHAKGLNDILDHTYDINNWDYMSQEIFRMATIYRSAFAYTGYDGKYKNGTGKLCIDIVNPRWVWVDPAANHLEDSRFFFYVEPMRKSQVIKLHPGIKQELNSVTNNAGNWMQGDFNGSGSSWFKTWLGTVKQFLTFNTSGTQAKQVERYTTLPELDEQDKYKNVIAYIHYWYRDDNDDWRCSYWADEILCKDEENPFYHGQLPYDILSPIKDPLSMFGVPTNEQLESMNAQRNLLMQYYIQNAHLQANPPMLFNTTMGNVRDPEKLREEAHGTGIIPVNNPDMVPLNAIADYVTVPHMDANTSTLFDHLGAINDRLSGVNDSFRGISQASSGKEVQLQQEAAYTRIKTMIDQFELFNKQISEKVISNAMQFYNETRAFRIKGDSTKHETMKQLMDMQGQEMPYEVKGIPQDIDQQTGEPIMSTTEYFMYANPNEWTKNTEMGEDDGEEQGYEEAEEGSGTELSGYGESRKTEVNGSRNRRKQKGSTKEKEKVTAAYKVLQMSVEIEAGSSLPQSRIARREEAGELFKAGAIDQEALLDAYDYPDSDKIMKRMADNAQRAQQAQAQQVQAEAQAKAQAEQMKVQAQMQIEQMKIQADMQKTQANNNAKLEQQQMSNRGQIAEQGMQNSGNDLSTAIQNIRNTSPEAQAFSDDELIEILTK